jgi:hypothetical protein
MDRFFSKLDLRDIKIKPEGSRFLPDDDEGEPHDEQARVPVSVDEQEPVIEESESIPYVPATGNGHVVTASYDRVTVTEWEAAPAVIEVDGSPEPALADGDAEVLKVSAKSRPSQVYLLARRSVFLSPPNGTLCFLVVLGFVGWRSRYFWRRLLFMYSYLLFPYLNSVLRSPLDNSV